MKFNIKQNFQRLVSQVKSDKSDRLLLFHMKVFPKSLRTRIEDFLPVINHARGRVFLHIKGVQASVFPHIKKGRRKSFRTCKKRVEGFSGINSRASEDFLSVTTRMQKGFSAVTISQQEGFFTITSYAHESWLFANYYTMSHIKKGEKLNNLNNLKKGNGTMAHVKKS